MIGVTIGIGDYRQSAYHAAVRMSDMTGLKCEVLTHDCGLKELPSPSWLKCAITTIYPKHDSFLVFDSDIICLRKWDPELIFESLGRPFCAALDLNSRSVHRECVTLNLGFPDVYVNGGLTIFGKEHEQVWSRTWMKRPGMGRWQEQGALNVSLFETDFEVCRLPRKLNFLSHFAKVPLEMADRLGVVNYHACSLGKASEVERVQREFGLWG